MKLEDQEQGFTAVFLNGPGIDEVRFFHGMLESMECFEGPDAIHGIPKGEFMMVIKVHCSPRRRRSEVDRLFEHLYDQNKDSEFGLIDTKPDVR